MPSSTCHASAASSAAWNWWPKSVASAGGVRCVVVDQRLEHIEPMAYRFLLNFAKDNELQVRDGRVSERTKLAELQRVGDTA